MSRLVGRWKKTRNFQYQPFVKFGFTRDEFDVKFVKEIDFLQAEFVYLHVEIKVRTLKSPNTSEFAGNLSLVNLPICTQSLAGFALSFCRL